MGRRRKKRQRGHRETDLEAVLAGREKVSADELFRLIHAVNPTGREVKSEREQKLYRLKSGLQSLLIRRHPELLEVETTDQAGVVSLDHRSGARDACHAVVDELDPDARSWVRHALDVAAWPAAAESPAPEAREPEERSRVDLVEGSAEESVRRGERAIAEYEYDVAEACLVRALRQGGGISAALPLLELRVELLGTDAEALALEPQLSPAVLENSRVRTLLALAAARSEEEERSLALLRGAPPSLSGPVFAALAHGAVRRGDTEAAARFLAETEASDPVHPRLDELRRELSELCAATARPAEAKLAERYEREGALCVEAEARRLLERYPQSEVARRVLSEGSEIKRQERIEGCLARAEEALAAERFRDAEKAFREAFEAGSDRPGLAELVDDLHRRAEEREDRERLAAVLAAFQENDARRAHLAFLALSSPLRSRLREQVERATLGWLEELGAPSSGQRAHAAVAAVLDLERATEEDPRAVVDRLEPHKKTLRPLRFAKELLEKARTRLFEGRRKEAREALEAGRKAAEAGRLIALSKLLDKVDMSALDEADKVLYDELRAQKERSEHYVRRIVEHDRWVEDFEYLKARDTARELQELAPDETTRKRWAKKLREHRESIRWDVALEVDTEELPLAELRSFRPRLLEPKVETWLDDEGKEVIFGEMRGAWLFLHVIDIERQVSLERLSLHGTPILPPVTVWREGASVRILNDDGGFLELARDGWEVLRREDLEDHRPSGALLDELFPVPGSSYIWVALADLSTEKLIQDHGAVFDLDTFRFSRDLSVVPRDSFRHPEGPFVVCGTRETRIFSARGAEVTGRRWPAATGLLPPHRLASVPGGGLLALSPLGKEGGLRLATVGGDAEAELRIPEGRSGSEFLLTCQEDGSIYVAYRTAAGQTRLLAARLEERGFEELYHVPFAWDTVFVQDRRGRHLAAVQLAGDHLRAVPLCPEAPPSVGPSLGRANALRPPPLYGPHPCEQGELSVSKSSLLRTAFDMPGSAAFIERFARSPYAAITSCLHVRSHLDKKEIEGRLQELESHFPEEKAARYLLACSAADDGSWDEVRRWLEFPGMEEIGGGFRRHYYHLLGVTELICGRAREALDCFGRGRREKAGHCDFEPLVELAEAVLSGELDERPPGASDPFSWQLWGAIREADRALSRNDRAAAIAALDRPAVWAAREIQSAARLASVWLDAEDEASSEGWHKRLALAAFVELHKEKGVERRRPEGDAEGPMASLRVAQGPRRRSYDIAPTAWGKERLEELYERAERWLYSLL